MPNDLDRDLDRESEAGWSDQGDEEHEEPSASGSAAIPVQQPQQVILFWLFVHFSFRKFNFQSTKQTDLSTWTKTHFGWQELQVKTIHF